jgi:hypothetical protein
MIEWYYRTRELAGCIDFTVKREFWKINDRRAKLVIGIMVAC